MARSDFSKKEITPEIETEVEVEKSAKKETGYIEVKPGLRFPKSKPQIDGNIVTFLGAHPSNTAGVKWTEKQELVWKPLNEEGFPAGAEYSNHRGFKDAAGRLRTTYLVRTVSELQLWAVEV